MSRNNKTNAVVFSLERSYCEPDYEKMAILLVKSLRDNNQNLNIYCGIFTNRMPSEETLQRLKAFDVNIYIDQKFYSEDDDINYFLRNYTIKYFSFLYETHNILYLDIDVVCLRNLEYVFNCKEFLVEKVPEYIVEKEKPYIGEINHPLYYNWVHLITKDSLSIYDINYDNLKYLKSSDIEISKRINNANIKVQDQNIGAYYPKHKLNNSYLFHYDSFIDSGTFNKLKGHPQYLKYKIYVEKILKVKIENDEQYWKNDEQSI